MQDKGSCLLRAVSWHSHQFLSFLHVHILCFHMSLVVASGCTMTFCKCWTSPYLAKWVPLIGHWLFLLTYSIFFWKCQTKQKYSRKASQKVISLTTSVSYKNSRGPTLIWVTITDTDIKKKSSLHCMCSNLFFFPYRVTDTHTFSLIYLWNLHILQCMCYSGWHNLKFFR